MLISYVRLDHTINYGISPIPYGFQLSTCTVDLLGIRSPYSACFSRSVASCPPLMGHMDRIDVGRLIGKGYYWVSPNPVL